MTRTICAACQPGRRCDYHRALARDYLCRTRDDNPVPRTSTALFLFVLADIPLPGSWAESGACRGCDTEQFFPFRGEPVAAARAVCAACPVIVDCRDYALRHPRLQGFWGGLSQRERRRIHRRRLEAA